MLTEAREAEEQLRGCVPRVAAEALSVGMKRFRDFADLIELVLVSQLGLSSVLVMIQKKAVIGRRIVVPGEDEHLVA
jgi:hypothetical protein